MHCENTKEKLLDNLENIEACNGVQNTDHTENILKI